MAGLLERFTRRRRGLPEGGQIIELRSTRPGELERDPQLKRLLALLGRFISGELIDLPPETKVLYNEVILDGGWVHPASRLAEIEQLLGEEIIGLEWQKENLRGRPVDWYGREMKHEPVNLLGKLT